MLKKEYWDKSLPLLILPRFKCPVCNSGHFVVDENTFHKFETSGSITLGEVTGNIEDYECRFSALSICDNPACKEPMVISGVTNLHPIAFTFEDRLGNEDYHGPPLKYVSRYTINYLSSPVKLIEVPKNMDSVLKELLDYAFLSFWTEGHTCANKIRHVLEYLLTEKLQVSKKGTLAEKIDKYLEESGKATMSQHFKALRLIGNSGSHLTDNKIVRTELMSAFAVLESILEEIFKDPTEIDKVSEEIIENRK